MEKTPITKEGLEKLKEELNIIKKIDRPNNIRDIEEARAHGDISENAEYNAAKEKQAFLEGKMNRLEETISSAEVIEIDEGPLETIVFGATVEIDQIDNYNNVSVYQLVGLDESDPFNDRIAVTSPLGAALIGKKVGDVVELRAPGGRRKFEVLSIRGV